VTLTRDTVNSAKKGGTSATWSRNRGRKVSPLLRKSQKTFGENAGIGTKQPRKHNIDFEERRPGSGGGGEVKNALPVGSKRRTIALEDNQNVENRGSQGWVLPVWGDGEGENLGKPFWGNGRGQGKTIPNQKFQVVWRENRKGNTGGKSLKRLTGGKMATI